MLCCFFIVNIIVRYAGTDSTIMMPLHMPLQAASPSPTPETTPDATAAAAAGTGGLGVRASTLDGSNECLARLASAIAATPAAFVAAYHREFGFVLQRRDIVVDDVRVRGIARGNPLVRDPAPLAPEGEVGRPPASSLPHASVFFEAGGRQSTPVYRLDGLAYGHTVTGPALIIDRCVDGGRGIHLV